MLIFKNFFIGTQLGTKIPQKTSKSLQLRYLSKYCCRTARPKPKRETRCV